MKKLAVIFPGVGYTCTKPLLYYTASVARDAGYRVLQLDYGDDIHTFKGRKEAELIPVIELAKTRVLENQLKNIDWSHYEKIVFISKSIGTVIACDVEKYLGLKVKQFLITPIPATMPYLGKVNGLFFSGTADPYISSKKVAKAVKRYPKKVGGIFEGCNHSLEHPGHTVENLKNVKAVVKTIKKEL
ncbi:MAG: hypothetical protein Q4D45_04345 [Lachnospiraceae bacterium]|nr:hypothetical protein [Lachnospiraceae bacterium]